MTQAVHVVRTGTANLASVLAALGRAGAKASLTADPAAVVRADRVLVPGVGAFAAAMEGLREAGLDSALRERIAAGGPTLGICLGMQVLAAASEESPGVAGLGVFPATVRRFAGAGGVRVPQLGWNEVVAARECRILRSGFAYFAHSYRLESVPEGWSGAVSDHGERFVAAFERGAVVGCQFHPELSAAWGLDLIRRWLDAGERVC